MTLQDHVDNVLNIYHPRIALIAWKMVLADSRDTRRSLRVELVKVLADEEKDLRRIKAPVTWREAFECLLRRKTGTQETSATRDNESP